jgi:hypothetical protein
MHEARAGINPSEQTVKNKIDEIIREWGQNGEDIKELHVEQLYERLCNSDTITYRPTNRFMLKARFFHVCTPRKTTFVIS